MCGEADGQVADQPEPGHAESDSVRNVRSHCISLAVFDDTHAEYRTDCTRNIICVFSFAVYYIFKSTYYR